MADIVKQDDDDPLLTYDGILFKRLLVDKVKGVNDKYYEVLLIAAIENGTSLCCVLVSCITIR